jgi:hypothetical protein
MTICVGRNGTNHLAGIVELGGIRLSGLHLKLTMSYEGYPLGSFNTKTFNLVTYGLFWDYWPSLTLQPNAGYYGCTDIYQGSTDWGSVCSAIVN